jgi:hypothetical protein
MCYGVRESKRRRMKKKRGRVRGGYRKREGGRED